MGQITYARVGGPPDCWRGLRVFNRATGLEVVEVVEVDTVEGYLIRNKRDLRGALVINAAGDAVEQERITGDFEIRVSPEQA